MSNILNLKTGEPFDPLPRLHHRPESSLAVSSSEVSGRARGMLLAAKSFYIGGAKEPTARDYVQTGLIAMWDGTENAGWGTHDASATSWKNLMGGASYDIALNSTISWLDDRIVLNGYAGSSSAKCPSTVEGKTLEVVCNHTYYNTSAWQYLISTYSTGSRPRCFAAFVGNGMNTSISGGYYHYKFARTSNDFAAYSFGGLTIAYENGIEKPATKGSAYGSEGSGIVLGASSSTDSASFQFRGQCACIRQYNRILSADEIASNYAVDKARFGIA